MSGVAGRTAAASDGPFKCVIVGPANTGKTSFVACYGHGDQLNATYMTTIGVDFANVLKNVDGAQKKVQIWDTAGQERFATIARAYHRGAKGMVFCFDLTRPAETLHKLQAIYDNFIIGRDGADMTGVPVLSPSADAKRTWQLPGDAKAPPAAASAAAAAVGAGSRTGASASASAAAGAGAGVGAGTDAPAQVHGYAGGIPTAAQVAAVLPVSAPFDLPVALILVGTKLDRLQEATKALASLELPDSAKADITQTMMAGADDLAAVVRKTLSPADAAPARGDHNGTESAAAMVRGRAVAAAWADRRRMPYFEVSSKTGEGIEQAMDSLLRMHYGRLCDPALLSARNEQMYRLLHPAMEWRMYTARRLEFGHSLRVLMAEKPDVFTRAKLLASMPFQRLLDTVTHPDAASAAQGEADADAKRLHELKAEAEDIERQMQALELRFRMNQRATAELQEKLTKREDHTDRLEKAFKFELNEPLYCALQEVLIADALLPVTDCVGLIFTYAFNYGDAADAAGKGYARLAVEQALEEAAAAAREADAKRAGTLQHDDLRKMLQPRYVPSADLQPRYVPQADL